MDQIGVRSVNAIVGGSSLQMLWFSLALLLALWGAGQLVAAG